MLKKAIKLGAFIGICESVGIAGAIFTSKSIPEWYSTLQKPSINPPSWVFGPVWTTLYALMGISAFIISEKKVKGKKLALSVFAAQLILNFLWTFLFFGMRSPVAALVEIIALWISILVTIILFWKISKTAALLLIPYLLWVSFASVLNLQIYRLN